MTKRTNHGRSGILGGPGGRTPICLCGAEGVRSWTRDAYYCPYSRAWLEAACLDQSCAFCAGRPESAEGEDWNG